MTSSQVHDQAVPNASREAELSAWMEQYGPGLQAFFARKVGRDEAQDLLQEVFVCLHSRAVSDDIGNVERYLFKVAHNVLASRRRNRGVRARRFDVALDRVAEPSHEVSPERIMLGRQDLERAMVAIRKLPPRTRTAFILHRFSEMTYPAIARRMGISQSAVRHLISRALGHILEDLEPSRDR